MYISMRNIKILLEIVLLEQEEDISELERIEELIRKRMKELEEAQ